MRHYEEWHCKESRNFNCWGVGQVDSHDQHNQPNFHTCLHAERPHTIPGNTLRSNSPQGVILLKKDIKLLWFNAFFQKGMSPTTHFLIIILMLTKSLSGCLFQSLLLLFLETSIQLSIYNSFALFFRRMKNISVQFLSYILYKITSRNHYSFL